MSPNRSNNIRVEHWLPPLIVLALLLSPTVYWLMIEPERSVVQKIGMLLFAAGLFLSPLFLFYKNLRIYFYLYTPFIVLAPLAIFYAYLYGSNISLAILLVVKETDFNEAREFISGFATILLAALLAYLAVFFFIVKRMPQKYPRRIIFRLSAFAVAGVCYLSIFHRENNSIYNKFVSRLSNAYPFYVIAAGAEMMNETAKIDHHQEEVRNFRFNAFNQDTLSCRKVYVFILGESARYDHWQINGYQQNTSPKLAARPELISYSNVSVGATVTRISVPIILTRATAVDFERNYSERSFIAAFREAGFKTHWLSNQGVLGEFDTNVTLHARDAENRNFINKSTALGYSTALDEKMIPLLDEAIAGSRDNVFIVIHTMGSHYKYDLRYPEAFDVFKPSAKNVATRLNNHAQKNRLINSYDNSILYADFIIDSVINVVNKYDLVSSVIYMSDHGEDLFDDAGNLSGHGNHPATPYVTQVPLFVWTSPRYHSAYPEKMENMRKNCHEEISADNMFYSILDLANIGYDGEDLSMSFASERFKTNARTFLTINGQLLNFDRFGQAN